MKKHPMRWAALAAALGLAQALAAPLAAHAQSNIQVIMNGLNNPRGLTFGPDGALYVAEAGSGGTGPGFSGEQGDVSLGATGAISRYFNGTQQLVFSGLPSLAAQTGPTPGGSATGLHDLAFSGNDLFGVIGLGADPTARSGLGAAGASLGQLVRLDLATNTWQNVADLAGYEGQNNPDGTTVDTNPYGLTALPGGGFLVADAGGNDLLKVSAGGTISTLSVFPAQPNPLPSGPPTYQAVPTSVAIGPDGAFYVGQLTGAPFPNGAANVYRVDPTTGQFTVAYSGFTNVTGLTFGRDGSLYVLELSEAGLAAPGGPGSGALIRIDPTTGARTTLASDGLLFPNSVVQGPDGALYVSNLGVAPGGGQVLRITQAAVPEPGTLALVILGLPVLVLLVVRRRKAGVAAA